jgi:hypothetical protein
MKMEQTECSETSAYQIQMPGNYPEDSIQHSEHGESFKSRICNVCLVDQHPFFSSTFQKPVEKCELLKIMLLVTQYSDGFRA